MEFMPIKIILCILWMYNTVFKVLFLARAQEYVEDDPVFWIIIVSLHDIHLLLQVCTWVSTPPW